jgi:chitodextrinase
MNQSPRHRRAFGFGRGAVFVAFLALGLFALAPGAAQAAVPANDDFANATVIDPAALPFSDVVDNTQATVQSGEHQYCSNAPRTVWWSFSPATSGVYSVDMNGSSFFDTAATVYQQDGSGLGGLTEIRCNAFPGNVSFAAQAGKTYYIQADDYFNGGGSLHLNVRYIPAPANDNFADATAIGSLPYSDGLDTTGASKEASEPFPCGSTGGTAWYAYTPGQSGSVTASAPAGFSVQLAAYTGTSLASLASAGCRYGSLTIHVDGGTTYYFQVGAIISGGGPMQFQLVQTPPPTAAMFFYPNDPTIYDTMQFYDQSYDPGGVGFSTESWNFGDGSTVSGCCPAHKYGADGDYTVKLSVGTPDGRSASSSQVVHVRTHDVTLSKLTVPQSASAGQTRQISVGVTNSRYPETVSVQLLVSVPGGGFQQVGVLQQQVAARGNNRPTMFTFNYTFTSADAAVGKVTFETVATIVGARDAQLSDNTVIALPTKVN